MATTFLRTALRSPRSAAVAALVGTALVAASITVPRLTGVEVHVRWPPLHAAWDPRLTDTTWVPVTVAVVLLATWPRIARLPWPAFLAVLFAGTWAWTMSLARVDGPFGLSRVFERRTEYVYDAQQVTSVHAALTGFADRIPLDAAGNWHVHVAGHPPGALLFFVLLDRLGVTDPYRIGVVVATLGCTAVVAAALLVRTLAGESWARRVAPWWLLAPAAIWVGVTGDALFMAVAAWGLALLALAATASAARGRVPYAVGAGVLLGCCVYLSYGLPLLGILALTVLHLARRWSPLPWAVGGALIVVAAFTAAGFRWWEAYPVLVTRYYDGLGGERPYSYWVWADLAAWTFTAGLAVWAAIPTALSRLRDRGPEAVVAAMGAAGLLSILVATVSGMSKAEVERIFLPFTLWTLMLPALLPARWQRPLLATQAVTAIALQSLVLTAW